MSRIELLYTLDSVSFLQIISDNVYIPKKTDVGHHRNKVAAYGHERAINVQNIELRYIDDCGVYHSF